MTSNPAPLKRSATKKKIKNEEQPPQIIKVEPPESKLKRLSDEQYKQRLENQFKERQEEKKRQEEERKKQEEEEERKKQEEQEEEQEERSQGNRQETAKNADLVEYAPVLPERTNGDKMPEIAFKFVMEIMPQLLEELERLKRYKGTKKNIHLKIPYGFNFEG
jgi:hypothetical protein